MDDKLPIPMLFPYEPAEFWSQIRQIIKEEIAKSQSVISQALVTTTLPGLVHKPLYKIDEICTLFKISKPKVYDWIKEGRLRKVKIKSRIYFLGNDIHQLLQL